MKELLSIYDFGHRCDVMTEDGDILPGEIEPKSADDCRAYDEMLADQNAGAPQQFPIEVAVGPSVSLEERARAMGALARMYARYARAKGLTKAVSMPHSRHDLDRRYADPEDVARKAIDGAEAGLSQESLLMAPLLKTEELVAAGFDSVDVQSNIHVTTMQVRRAVGSNIGASKRNEVVKSLNIPTV